jgi:hypothetical protein
MLLVGSSKYVIDWDGWNVLKPSLKQVFYNEFQQIHTTNHPVQTFFICAGLILKLGNILDIACFLHGSVRVALLKKSRLTQFPVSAKTAITCIAVSSPAPYTFPMSVFMAKSKLISPLLVFI